MCTKGISCLDDHSWHTLESNYASNSLMIIFIVIIYIYRVTDCALFFSDMDKPRKISNISTSNDSGYNEKSDDGLPGVDT